MSPQTWLITGASSGFGLSLALQALALPNTNIIGTVRSRQRSAPAVSQIEQAGGKVLELDVTDAKACFEVYAAAEEIYGRVDVLVNNAGMSYLGALEDFTDEEVEAQMNVNLYGPFRLIRAALPGFRERKEGMIVNVTSIAGVDGIPSSGVYAASKFALEGLSEALAREVADYNIKVLIVEPGAFRTNFLDAFKRTKSEKCLQYYAPVQTVFHKFATWSGKQPGDPVKAAKVMAEVISGQGMAGHLKGETLRLPLGRDCFQRIEAKVASFKHDLEKTHEVAHSTDIEEPST